MEEGARGPRRRMGKLGGIDPAASRHGFQNVGQVHGFVAPAFRAWFEVPWKEIGRIGLQHEALQWNTRHELA